jgi:hypothetical protein
LTDIFEPRKNKSDLWETESHLGYRGSSAWLDEKTTVAEMVDLKILSIRLFTTSFKSRCEHEKVSTTILCFYTCSGVVTGVDRLKF